MREFTVIVWGTLAVVLGHWAGGLAWSGAVFLFFPGFGLASAILNNEGRHVVKNAVTLLLLPFMLAAAPGIVTQLVASVQTKAPIDPIGMKVLGFVAAAALWGVFTMLAEFVSHVVGAWSMPDGVHGIVVRAIAFVAYASVFQAAVWGLHVLDRQVLHLPAPVKVILPIAMTALFILALVRLFTRRLETASAASSSRGRDRAPNGSSVRLAERPTVTFADVAGMAEVKDQIRLRLVEPVRNAARARQYGLKVGGGMLLYGPPGTGKTLLARAVAGELGLPFYVITPADVFGKYVGDSERNIRRLFADIRKNPLSVVFIDELETLFPNRSNDVHETTRKVISVLLQELDGIDQGKNPMLLIGATNVPWLVDEAFLRPGRFDVKTFVGLPDVEARRGILERAFAKGAIPRERGLVEYMAGATPNYSGADLNGVMTRLRQMAYDRNLPAYTHRLAEEALAQTSPTANGEALDKIRDWEAENLPENSSNAGSSGIRLAVTPDVTLDDVAGMEDVKEQIRLRLIEPVLHRTMADLYGIRAGGGMLLYGPPGTGKTFLARAVAGELQLPFYCITAADVFGKFVGESERNVRRIFRDIRKNPLSVVFMDELEALVPNRSTAIDEAARKVISVLLQELDGMDQTKNPMLLIGATNVPWLVDEAFLRPGRFDVKVYVGLPDRDARRQIFINHLYSCKIPHTSGLTGYLAQRTEGYTGADINGVWERMKQIAYRRQVKAFDPILAQEVLAASRPTPSQEIVRRIREWEYCRKAGDGPSAPAGAFP